MVSVVAQYATDPVEKVLSYVSFTAYAVHLCDVGSLRIESNQYSSSLVSPPMCMRSSDDCVMVAVCVRVTFQSVHVEIEMHTQPYF